MQIDDNALAVAAASTRAGTFSALTMGEHRDICRAAITAYLQALSPGSTGETEGWVLVPKEPTLAMCNAGWREVDRQGFEANDIEVAPLYRAMLSAAGERG